jgi:uncharacterized protein YbcI
MKDQALLDPRRRDGRKSDIEGKNLNPEDAASLREPLGGGQGNLRGEISTAMVGLYKDHYGKGPTHCRTYLEPDLVIVILGEGYTPGEKTMFEAGKWYEVREARQLWQDSMEGRFIAKIEELSGRKVKAFMSANRQDPDLSVEMFLLEPGEDGQGAPASGSNAVKDN